MELSFIPYIDILSQWSLQTYIVCLAAYIVIHWLLPARLRAVFLSLGATLFILLIDWAAYGVLLFMAVSLYALTKVKTRSTLLLLAGLAFLIIPFIVHETARAIYRGSDIYDLIFMTGMAFYTLRLIHYWFECFKQKLPQHNFLDFYTYTFFLPIFIVGPIYRFEDFHKWEQRKRVDWERFFDGILRIIQGAFMVVVLSGYFVNQLLRGWIDTLQPEQTFANFYAFCLEYGLNIYFQFAGYSSIAIGIGALLGHRVCENFHHPFFRENIVEFWKHWHMSLTGWVRQYIFLPIVTYTGAERIALMLSMCMIGVWHGFTLNALMWGIYHGIGINLYHWYRRSQWRQSLVSDNTVLINLWRYMSILLTFHYVILGNYLLK